MAQVFQAGSIELNIVKTPRLCRALHACVGGVALDDHAIVSRACTGECSDSRPPILDLNGDFGLSCPLAKSSAA